MDARTVPKVVRTPMVRGMPTRHALIALLALSASLPAVAQSGSFVNWESPQSHPIDLTPNGQVLLAVNTPDARLGPVPVT